MNEQDELGCDVLVIGAGSAGILACQSAAEAGAEVVVVDSLPEPGGLAVHGIIGTICGLFRAGSSSPQFSVDGPARQLASALLNTAGAAIEAHNNLRYLLYDPGSLAEIYHQALAPVALRPSVVVIDVERQQGAISSVTAIHSGDGRRLKIYPKCVVDCSGTLISCSPADYDVALHSSQAAAFSFRMQPRPTDVKKQMMKALVLVYRNVASGRLPQPCKNLAFVPQTITHLPVTLKLALLHGDQNRPMSQVKDWAQAIADLLSSELGWDLLDMSSVIGERSSKAIPKTVYQLTADDVTKGHLFSDGVVTGFWPIEFWPADGGRVQMKAIGGAGYYTVPARCLKSKTVDNLWFAGKVIGAQPLALASTRVIATCWQTGYAAGLLAATQADGGSLAEAVKVLKSGQAKLG